MAIVILVGTSATVIAQYLLTFGVDRLPAQIIRFFLTCTLAFFLYRGARWTRWTTIGLLSVAILGAALSGQYALPIAYACVIWNLLGRDTRAFLEEMSSSRSLGMHLEVLVPEKMAARIPENLAGPSRADPGT